MEAGLEVKSVIINETDFGKYRKSFKSTIDLNKVLEKIKELAG